MHVCIQVADVGLDAVVLPDATATSGVSDVDASHNHMNELSPIKQNIYFTPWVDCNLCPHLWTQKPENKATDRYIGTP